MTKNQRGLNKHAAHQIKNNNFQNHERTLLYFSVIYDRKITPNAFKATCWEVTGRWTLTHTMTEIWHSRWQFCPGLNMLMPLIQQRDRNGLSCRVCNSGPDNYLFLGLISRRRKKLGIDLDQDDHLMINQSNTSRSVHCLAEQNTAHTRIHGLLHLEVRCSASYIPAPVAPLT